MSAIHSDSAQESLDSKDTTNVVGKLEEDTQSAQADGSAHDDPPKAQTSTQDEPVRSTESENAADAAADKVSLSTTDEPVVPSPLLPPAPPAPPIPPSFRPRGPSDRPTSGPKISGPKKPTKPVKRE